jgi:hypothetical protein
MPLREKSKKSGALAAMAHARPAEKKISYTAALSEIAREHPGLVDAARQEVLGRTLRYESLGRLGNIQVVDLGEQLSKLARARAAEKNISIAAALSEIGAEAPEFVHAVREQVLGRKV